MIKRLVISFQGLRWKLTLSYTLVTVAALLVVMLIAVLLVWVIVTNSNIYPRALVAVVRDEIVPQIAIFLDNPDPDVNGHLSNILGKLHLADRTQAAVYAWREGIVRRDPR